MDKFKLNILFESKDKSNIEIKEIPINEYSILRPLYKEFVKDTAKKTKHTYLDKTIDLKIKQLKKCKYGVIYVAYNKTIPVGFVMGSINDDNPPNILSGNIMQLVVSNKYRRQGIASNLCIKIDKWLDSKNTRNKWVTSLYGNKEAISLYKSLGYHPELLVMRQ